jgi:hypothetical protein
VCAVYRAAVSVAGAVAAVAISVGECCVRAITSAVVVDGITIDVVVVVVVAITIIIDILNVVDRVSETH